MSVSQQVRGQPSVERPTGILSDIIALHQILVNNTPPIPTTGKEGDYFIDSGAVGGDLYGPKTGGVWGPPIYNFGSGGGGGGLTNCANIGEGVRNFQDVVGSVARFRTMTSSLPILIEEDDPIVGSNNFSMSALYKPPLLSGIFDNAVLGVSFGVSVGDPNGVIGGLPQWPDNSVVVQAGTNHLWILQDTATKTWITFDASSGVSDIVNVGIGNGKVLKNITSGVASLKSIDGTDGQVTITDKTNEIQISMVPSYRPVTLAKLFNIQDNRGAPLSAPTVNDDSNAGYQRGSIWIEQEIGNLNKLWICNSSTPGAADWVLYPSSSSTGVKDYASWHNGIGYTFTILGTIQDFNFGDPGNIVSDVSAPSTHFSTQFDGSRQIFTRSLVTKQTNYRCSINFIARDFLGAPSTDEAVYRINCIRKSNSQRFGQSFAEMVLPISTVNQRAGFVSVDFMINEPSTAALSYYFQMEGLKSGGGAAQNINIEKWSVTFQEL